MKRNALTQSAIALCGCIAASVMLPLHTSHALILDDFNVNEGHFTSGPASSGSTLNVAGSSTMDRVITDSPREGTGHQKLVLNATTAGVSMTLRHLSGGGSAGANTAFTTSAATDGWLGVYIKTLDASSDPNWTVQIWIEGPSNNGSNQKTIIADGQWHLYEWNLDDTTGGVNGWGNVPGIVTGSATVANGSHTIDSILFRNSTGPATTTLFMDFVALNPVSTVADLLTNQCVNTSGVLVNGPLSTNLNQVVVNGVNATASAVTVYQNTGPSGSMVSIGAKTTGITAGNNTVTVSGLVKNARVVATQTVNGQESCVPDVATGVAVGGGPNPRLRMAASIRQPGNVAGPIGANGGGPTATIYWIHATGANVAGGTLLQPSTNWQTVIFYPTDSKFIWNAGTATLPDLNQYGILEGFGLGIDDLTDSGPYEVYFDNLRNGTTLIQDFEGEATGSEVQFPKPGNSGTTSGNILSTPDSSVVSTNQAASGTNSIVAKWQWRDTTATKWIRYNALSTGGIEPTPNPVVDLTQPIAIDVLLLPVDKTNAHSIGYVGLVENRTNCLGESVTFSVSNAAPVNASPTYTYQWKFKNVNIPGATTSSFTTNNIGAGSAGAYSVAVSDGVYTVTPSATLTIPPGLLIDSQPTDQGPVAGDGTGTASFLVQASVPSTCPCNNSPLFAYQWRQNGTPIAGATDSSYQINNTFMTNAGVYTVLVSNTCNKATLVSAGAKLYLTDPSVTPITASCSGSSGLLGFYWTNQTSVNAFSGTATWTNVDAQIDFDWITAGPVFDIYAPTNNFVTRWVGTVQPYYPNQTYTFFTRSDDGVRLWVNGKLLIDKWVAQATTEWTNTIALGSAPVPIVLEYFEQTSDARVFLSWDSLSVAKQVIPNGQLCAADADTGVPPISRLASPTNNATATAGAQVTLTANVTAFSAPVNKVDFYNNSTNLLASVNAPGPYTTPWTPPATGVYNITARAYYQTTNSIDSPSNKLTVSGAALGSVSATISGTSLNYTGGAGSQFVLLKTTNISTPLASWTRVATNTVTPGSFSIPVGSEAQAYYSVKSE